MATQIRVATIADHVALADLWGEADAFHHAALPRIYAPPPDPARSSEVIAAILDDPDQGLLVACDEERPVGLVHVTLRERRPPMLPKRFAVVEAIVVAAAHRGTGIGRSLMEAAHRWAGARGAVEIWLDVGEFNAGAIGFYEALGYETVSHRMRREFDAFSVDGRSQQTSQTDYSLINLIGRVFGRHSTTSKRSKKSRPRYPST
jgi:ribosomal protein S18 acetylase RimI-like enzyme